MALKTRPVIGTVYLPDGSPAVKARVIAKLNRLEKDGGIVVPQVAQSMTDETGAYSIDLWPNQRGTGSSAYRVIISNAAPQDQAFNIVVPDGVDPVAMESLINLPPYPSVDAAQAAIVEAQAAAASAGASASQADSAKSAAQSSATSAGNSADSANTSAADAIAAKNAAIAAKEDAQDAKTDIINVYYGPLPDDPSQRPDGTAMHKGDRYFNTTNSEERTFDGTNWYVANVDGQALANQTDPTKGAAIVGYDGDTVQAVLDEAKPMQSYTALRNYTGRATGVRITTPGIDGIFQRDDSDSATADDGGVVIVDQAGRRWKRLFEGYVNIRWFGADPNAADNTAAINNALAHIRNAASGSASEMRPVLINGLNGVYTCLGPINATNITQGKGWGIRDLHLLSKAAGKSAFELIGSRWGLFDNFHIRGGEQYDDTKSPWDGLVMARSSTVPCSHHAFFGCSVDGYFLNAAFHNYASEELFLSKCVFLNRRVPDTGNDSLAGILEGRDSHEIRSDFESIVTGRKSFTVSNYQSCAFQKPFGITGPALYLEDIANQSFTKLYATNGGGGAIIQWKLNPDFTPYAIDIDVQMETDGAEVAFEFIGTGSNVGRMHSLDIKTGNMFPDIAMFRATDIGRVVLQAFKLRIPTWQGTAPASLFDPAGKFDIDGDIVLPSSSDIGNVSNLYGFTGSIYGIAGRTKNLYGLLRQADIGILNSTGNVTTNSGTVIADDTVYTVDLAAEGLSSIGILTMWSSAADIGAYLHYIATSLPSAPISSKGSLVDIVTGTTLSGTTGADGRFTIAINDGQIQFENRRGFNVTMKRAILS